MISLKYEISKNLALRSSAQRLFVKINNESTQDVEVDFSDIMTISRSFASEYIANKKNTSKTIHEINLPLNVKKMFDIVNRNNPKTRLVQTEIIYPIRL